MHEKKKKLYTKGKIEIMLKGHPDRLDLPVPQYFPGGQISQGKALSSNIDFKEFPILRILNLHCAIWVNYLDYERSSPSRTEFTWKDVQSRVL